MLGKKDLSQWADSETPAAGQPCPKCGAGRLFREQLSDGRTELICLNLDCDYMQVVSEPGEKEGGASGSVGRMTRMTVGQLQTMHEKLVEACETLRGRSKRLAKQQLALVQAELDRRTESMDDVEVKRSETLQEELLECIHKMPPQLNTPQATARRLAGIRKYHNRQRTKQVNPRSPVPSRARVLPGMGVRTAQWFERLLKTLRDEALRHEQAARNYSRTPELFALHIEHSARAFELNRVLDLLDNYADIMGGQNARM